MTLVATKVPTYTFPQGSPGPNNLSGVNVGAPANSVGQNGQFFTDTGLLATTGPKANGAWPGFKSLIGPKGISGPPAQDIYPSFGNYNFMVGSPVGEDGTLILGQTRNVRPYNPNNLYGFNTVYPSHTFYLVNYTLHIISASSGAYMDLQLVDTVSNTVLFEDVPDFSLGPFFLREFTNDIVLTGGSNIVWRVSGSGSVAFNIFPTFLVPQFTCIGAQTLPPAGYGAPVGGIPTNYSNLLVPDANNSFFVAPWQFQSVRTSGLISMYLQNGTDQPCQFIWQNATLGTPIYTSSVFAAGQSGSTGVLDPGANVLPGGHVANVVAYFAGPDNANGTLLATPKVLM